MEISIFEGEAAGGGESVFVADRDDLVHDLEIEIARHEASAGAEERYPLIDFAEANLNRSLSRTVRTVTRNAAGFPCE